MKSSRILFVLVLLSVQSALVAAKLRFGISIKKDASASFRQAKIVRP